MHQSYGAASVSQTRRLDPDHLPSDGMQTPLESHLLSSFQPFLRPEQETVPLDVPLTPDEAEALTDEQVLDLNNWMNAQQTHIDRLTFAMEEELLRGTQQRSSRIDRLAAELQSTMYQRHPYEPRKIYKEYLDEIEETDLLGLDIEWTW